jgi:hypothetical protein
MSTPEQQPVDPAKIARLFSHPLHIPSEFKSWMLDQLVLNVPDLPVGQAFPGSRLAKQLKHDATEVDGSGFGDTIFSCTVKGGSLGLNGRLVIDQYFIASCGDVSNLGHIQLYLGGNLLATVRLATAFLSFTPSNGMVRWTILNANSYALQRVWGFSWIAIDGTVSGAPANGAFGTGAVDTQEDQVLQIKTTWDGAGSQAFTNKLTTAQVYNPVASG